MSEEDENSAMLHRMEQASFLSTEDPIRQKLEAEISIADEGVREQWLQQLHESAQLRLAVNDVPMPPGLQDRLALELEDEFPSLHQPSKKITFRFLMVAAIFVLGLGIGWWVSGIQGQSSESAIHEVMLMAADDHINDRHLSIETSDPDVLTSTLSKEVDFVLKLPKMKSSAKLIGGRACHWGDCQIIFTLWECEGTQYSLLQFDPNVYHMPSTMNGHKTCCDKSIVGHRPLDVAVWSENGRGYALVGKHGGLNQNEWFLQEG